MIMPYNLELERKYSMTLSELYELANRVIVAMQRDIADFAQFKILPANLTALEALTAQYYDNLNDEMYKAEHSYAIQLRNELRETLQHYLKRLALAAKNAFKNAPSIYNALVLPNVAKLTDKVFVVDIGNVYKNAVQNKTKLEAEGIHCFPQDGTGISENTDLVVVSTAIEDTVAEVQKAKQLNIPILKRSQVLAMIAESKKLLFIMN